MSGPTGQSGKQLDRQKIYSYAKGREVEKTKNNYSNDQRKIDQSRQSDYQMDRSKNC